ncbi:MAG TPA: hypothetical protein VGG16_17410 [Streptosporangiaceae bacterium]|jgi:hypothetical protein
MNLLAGITTPTGIAPTVRPASAGVTCWGELPAERPIHGVLRVRIGGEHAGAIERAGDRWVAYWYAGMTRAGNMRDRDTEHDNADDAVRAVLRSAWARRLGGRAASTVIWSERARRAAHRAGSR